MHDKQKYWKRSVILILALSAMTYGMIHPAFSHIESIFFACWIGLGLFTAVTLFEWLFDTVSTLEHTSVHGNRDRFIIKGGQTIRVSLTRIDRYINATTQTAMFVSGYHVDRYGPDAIETLPENYEPVNGGRLERQEQPLFVNLDDDGHIQFLSTSLIETFKLNFETVLGQSIATLPHVFGEHSETLLEDVKKHYYAHKAFQTVIENEKKWFLWTYEAVLNGAGHIDFIIAMVHDISHTLPSQVENHLYPHKDYLTGELNQLGLYQALESFDNVEKAVSIFIDIKQFSKINDYYGHQFGDQVLLGITRHLNQRIDGKGLLSRVSGDKFVLFLKNTEAEREALRPLLSELNQFIVHDLLVEGVSVPLEKAIGYAVYPDDCQTLDGLISLSSLAMEESARTQPLRITRYTESMREALHYDFTIAHKLKKALEDDALEVHFQHVVNVTDNTVVYLEALGRWFDQDLGMIPPQVFFQAAESTNLLDRLDRQLIARAIAEFVNLRQKPTYANTRLSLNIAPASLLNPQFFNDFNATVKKAGLSPEDVCLEVSEKTFVSRIDQSRQAIQNYKDKGYIIALDDFGKEYSSLAILDHLTFDIIKIDAVFTQSIDTIKSREIVKMIRKITDLSEKELVIEGVETAEQSRAVLELGCPLQQGYFHHRPARLT